MNIFKKLFGKLSGENEVTDAPNTFTDRRDGQVYRTVELNGRIWMAQNLNYDVGEGCWLYYNDPDNNEEKYGRLYTWEALRRACPRGWHIPTDEEWKQLANSFRGYSDMVEDRKIGDPEKAYKALIEGGSSGFSAVLGGWHFFELNHQGHSERLGSQGSYWSATVHGNVTVYIYEFRPAGEKMKRKLLRCLSFIGEGLSCRCVRN